MVSFEMNDRKRFLIPKGGEILCLHKGDQLSYFSISRAFNLQSREMDESPSFPSSRSIITSINQESSLRSGMAGILKEYEKVTTVNNEIAATVDWTCKTMRLNGIDKGRVLSTWCKT